MLSFFFNQALGQREIIPQEELNEIELNFYYEKIDDLFFDSLLIKYPNSDFLVGMKIYYLCLNNDEAIKAENFFDKYRKNKTFKYGSFIYFGLGVIELKKANLERSLKFFHNSLKINNSNKWAYLELYHYYYKNNFTKAISFLENAIKIDNSFYFAVIEYSNFLINENKINEALEYLNKLNSNKSDYLFYLKSYCYLKLENFNNAKENLISAIKIKEDPLYYLSLGYVEQYGEKQNVVAKEYYLKAIKLNPNESNAYLRLGILYKELKELDSAYFYYTKALKLKESFDNYMDLIYICFNLEKYSEVEVLNNTSKLKFGIKKEHYFWDILLYTNQKYSEKAQETINSFYKIFSNDDIIWLRNELNEWNINIIK